MVQSIDAVWTGRFEAQRVNLPMGILPQPQLKVA
jgi:hypothetical protein